MWPTVAVNSRALRRLALFALFPGLAACGPGAPDDPGALEGVALDTPWTTTFPAAARDVRPNSACSWRSGAEVMCPPLFGAVAGDALPCSAPEGRFGAEGPGTPSCKAADGASPCTTSLCRSTSLPCARTTLCCTVSVSRRAGLLTVRGPLTEPRPPVARGRAGS